MMTYITRYALVALIAIASTFSLTAQEEEKQAVGLMNPTYQFSKKKTAYVTLMDGTEITGNVKDFDRKKGVTDFIKIKGDDGKTYKLDAEEIHHAYFYPTALSKLASFYDDMKVQHWHKDLNEDMFENGYVYLEQTEVKIKKKTRNLLVQLLNPHFSEGIKIYFDPLAKETMSVGIGPMSVGGDAKSYFVKKNGANVAIKLKKKDYDEEFNGFFGGCDAIVIDGKPRWSELAEHAYTYGQECAK